MKSFFLISIFFLTSLLSYSQMGGQSATDTQWWLGLRAGVSTTSVNVLNSYSVLKSDQGGGGKDYTSRLGYFIGIETDFDIFGLVEISFLPGLRQVKYNSTKDYLWSDSLGAPMYDLNLSHDYNLLFLDLPLVLKLNFVNMANGGIKIKGKNKKDIKISSGGGLIAFGQVGIYYNRLLTASTSIEKTVEENGKEVVSNYAQGMGNNYLKNSYGWIIGGGVGYDFQSVRLELDVAYRKSFHNMTNIKNRYSETILVNDYYEVVDDVKFSNLEFALRILFPFKFVYSGSFKKA